MDEVNMDTNYYIRKEVYAEDTKAPHGEVNMHTNYHIRRGICGGHRKRQLNRRGEHGHHYIREEVYAEETKRAPTQRMATREVNMDTNHIRETVYAEDTKAPHGEVNTPTTISEKRYMRRTQKRHMAR
jgi:hypothetical protein